MAAVYDNTSDGGSVASDKFCRRVNHNIRTVFKRAQKIGGGEGVIHHQRNFIRMSDFCHSLDIDGIGIGISNGFDKNSFCVLLDSVGPIAPIRIHKGSRDAKFREGMRQ